MSTAGRAPGLLGFVLRRRWAVILGVTVVLGALLTAALSRVPAHSYQVTKSYLVARQGGNAPAGITDETDRFARDYAAVLTSDVDLLDVVGARVGTSGEHVRDHLRAVYLKRASAIVVRYEDRNRAQVLGVISGLDEALLGPSSPSPALPAGLLRSLGTPAPVVLTSPLRAVPGAGFVLALLVGFVGAVLLERGRPRVVNRAQLQSLTPHAVLSLDGLTEEHDAVDVLAVRVLEHVPQSVSVCCVDGSDATALVQQLTAAAGRLTSRHALDPQAVDVPIRQRGVAELPELSAGELRRESWVVVARTGQPLRSLEQVLEALDEAGDVVIALGTVPAATQPSALAGAR